jgi:hypothetical protein
MQPRSLDRAASGGTWPSFKAAPAQSSGSATKFADYQVVYLDRDIPSDHRIAMIPWHWSAISHEVIQVGAGEHDGDEANGGELRWRTATTYGGDNDDGSVMLTRYTTNDGDSGGPIFTFDWNALTYQVHGALQGSTFQFPYLRTHYTSTSYHHADITKALGHVGEMHTDYPGNDREITSGISHRQCVSQCMQSTACKSYTWVPAPGAEIRAHSGTCYEKSVGRANVRSASYMRSGYRLSTGTCNSASTDGICRL